jgi:hypothetical protein
VAVIDIDKMVVDEEDASGIMVTRALVVMVVCLVVLWW